MRQGACRGGVQRLMANLRGRGQRGTTQSTVCARAIRASGEGSMALRRFPRALFTAHGVLCRDPADAPRASPEAGSRSTIADRARLRLSAAARERVPREGCPRCGAPSRHLPRPARSWQARMTPRRTSHAPPSSRIPLSALQLFWPADRLLTRQGTYLIGWNDGRSLEFDLRPIFRRDRR